MVDGKVDLGSGVADGLEVLLSMPMKGGLKTTADETGSMPMGRRTVRFPS